MRREEQAYIDYEEALIREHVEFYSSCYNPNQIIFDDEEKDSDKPFTEITTPQITIDEAAGVNRIITDIYNDNNILYSISARKFEEIMAFLLQKKGFEVHLTKQTKDGGFDILCLYYIINSIRIKLLVECKKITP